MTKQFSRLMVFVLVLFASALVSAQGPTPVTLNFDESPNLTLVTTQYGPRVLFSATNFSGGSGGPFGWDLYTLTYPSQFSGNRAVTGLNNYCGCYSGGFTTFIDFSVPVNNLTFNVLNVGRAYGSPAVFIDVYRNHTFYQTYYAYSVFGQSTLPILFLGGIPQITDVEIYNISNYDPFGTPIPLYYDDFGFTPDLNVTVTNPRISGSLNGTTQNALVGANIFLNTNITPAGRTGGAYSWIITGPYQLITGSTNASTLNIRATDVGTLTAEITYTLNGYTAKGKITINAILPTLTSFTAATNAIDQLSRDQYCSTIPSVTGVRYSLGCWQPNGADIGVIFSANAQIPPGQYLTDLGQSGIKIKQFISEFRKKLIDTPPAQFVLPTHGAGNIQCSTFRSSEDDVDSGWAIDGPEAQSAFVHIPPTFNLGTNLQVVAFDAPADTLETTWQGYLDTYDDFFVDDRFQTYVYYFVGDPLSPTSFQRPLRLSSESTYQYSYIGWKFNGQAVFDSSVPLKYRMLFSNTPKVVSGGTNALPILHTPPTSYAPCPGDTFAASTNQIDGARCFVYQQYWDFLNRAPDSGGWIFWRSQIASCLFDRACITTRRTLIANEFFRSAEFQQSDPAMANPPGSPNFDPSTYNPAFVRHCYENFLRRQPDPSGFDFWVGVLNSNSDYLGVIGAFSSFPEYRNRGNFHTCPSL